MSEEEQLTPSVPPPTPSLPPLEPAEGEPDPDGKKKSPKWISASDLPDIINILTKADKISPQEAVNRLNNMVSKGVLVIVPLLGTRRRA